MTEFMVSSPWWATTSGLPNDYTRFRTSHVSYTVDDKIGRRDYQKYTLSTDTPTTVSGEGTILI